MNITGAVALVTGGSRGLGKAITQELLLRGASKVYATARAPRPSMDSRIVPERLDVSDCASVERLARIATDVDIVVNNAAVMVSTSILQSPVADIRTDFETNVFGVIHVARAFAPILAKNGGGALLNIHSVASWLASDGGYSASKAAVWSVTNSLRLELSEQGTLVSGLHVGYIDTDMVRHITEPKNAPAEVARQAVAGLEANELEILVDDITRWTKAGLSTSPLSLHPHLARAPGRRS
jgi:NAD(P)-dependent dehydrogenase (short-subunit alcohol dehydrogenase family)